MTLLSGCVYGYVVWSLVGTDVPLPMLPKEVANIIELNNTVNMLICLHLQFDRYHVRNVIHDVRSIYFYIIVTDNTRGF